MKKSSVPRLFRHHIVSTVGRQYSLVQQKEEFKLTVNPVEIEKFNILSRQWWNPQGPLRLLHKMNGVRLPFIQEQISQRTRWTSLKDLKVLDIGCGAGILSEPLARLGAHVTGLDASARNIEAAKEHAKKDPSLKNENLRYIYASTTEYLAEEGASEDGKFDVITAMEIIEHVNSPCQFIADISQLLRPGGLVFLSTINRTFLARLLTIDLAETVFGLVEQGTHDYSKYVRPSELESSLKESKLVPLKLQGVTYLPFIDAWTLIPTTEINYMLVAKKEEEIFNKI